MPLFECSKCYVVENTAISDYWIQQKKYVEKNSTLDGFEGICSECLTGRWHGEFPRQTVEEANLIEDDHGFLQKDPGDEVAIALFKELLTKCSPSEQRRIVDGCKAGYFAPQPLLPGVEQPPSIPGPARRKRRKQGT